MEAIYAALLDAQAAVIAALTPGAPLSAAHAAAVAALVARGHADLVPKLTRSVGFGMGLELREGKLQLVPGNEARVAPGMVFNVSVGLDKLDNPGAKRSKDQCASALGSCCLSRPRPPLACTSRTPSACLRAGLAAGREAWRAMLEHCGSGQRLTRARPQGVQRAGGGHCAHPGRQAARDPDALLAVHLAGRELRHQRGRREGAGLGRDLAAAVHGGGRGRERVAGCSHRALLRCGEEGCSGALQ